MLECLSLLYADNKRLDLDDNLARNGRINWVKAKLSHLLPYTVHVVLQGLEEIVSSVDRDKQRYILSEILNYICGISTFLGSSSWLSVVLLKS